MRNLASELEKRFDQSAAFYASMADGPTFREYTEEEARVIDSFVELSDSIQLISPELWRETEELRASSPDDFEQILDALLSYVGGASFNPTSANEFVQKLNEFVRMKKANPEAFRPKKRADSH